MLELESLTEISPTTHAHAEHHHDNDPGPCPGCPNFARCGRKLIACEAFAAFVRRDRRWPSASRSPLAETYRAVMT